MKELIKQADHVYVIGNGGSAAIASHFVNDLINVCKVKAHTLHDPSIFSCMANDYGYENVFSKQLEVLMTGNDLLVAISSSGKSKNMLNAYVMARRKGAKVMTLTGFEETNPLRRGDLNIWVDSKDYGFIECEHQRILHEITDTYND